MCRGWGEQADRLFSCGSSSSSSNWNVQTAWEGFVSGFGVCRKSVVGLGATRSEREG